MDFFAALRGLAARCAAHARGFLAPRRLGVRGLILDSEGWVLLVRHTYVSGWYLPGGGVEAGESAVGALRRELYEEGGVELLGAPRLHGLFFNPKASRRDYVACYVVRDFRVTPTQPNFEIAEARFFPVNAVPEDTSPATRARLAEVLTGTSVPDVW
ncbi:MAG: NUDIX domain-containing protein [Methylovirgula sp.]